MKSNEAYISTTQLRISRLCQILAAIIMLQTLYFKFSSAEESVEIFTAIGMEPWGRYGVGILELIASVMLFIRPLVWMGALLGIGLMSGAMYFHFTIIGLSVHMDHGHLFILALTTFICCMVIAYIRKSEIPIVNKW